MRPLNISGRGPARPHRRSPTPGSRGHTARRDRDLHLTARVPAPQRTSRSSLPGRSGLRPPPRIGGTRSTARGGGAPRPRRSGPPPGAPRRRRRARGWPVAAAGAVRVIHPVASGMRPPPPARAGETGAGEGIRPAAELRSLWAGSPPAPSSGSGWPPWLRAPPARRPVVDSVRVSHRGARLGGAIRGCPRSERAGRDRVGRWWRRPRDLPGPAPLPATPLGRPPGPPARPRR